jgi:hypothetical protein
VTIFFYMIAKVSKYHLLFFGLSYCCLCYTKTMFPHQVTPPQGNADLEVVGLMGIGNGCSCNIHQYYGVAEQVGDLLRLVKTVVTGGNQSEEAIKPVRVIDCVDGSTVGFIPRYWTNLEKVQSNIDKSLLVK